MRRFYVYGIFKSNKTIDECFYIGKGCDDRLNHHFMQSHKGRNPHLDSKINKIENSNNSTCYSRIIYDNIEEEKAYDLEQFLINEIGLDNLTNMREGGYGFRSKEDHPFYNQPSEKHPMFGKQHSEEAKKKISEASCGRKPSKKVSKLEAQEIKWLCFNSNLTQSDISDRYPIGQSCVSRINREDIWEDLKPRKPQNFK